MWYHIIMLFTEGLYTQSLTAIRSTAAALALTVPEVQGFDDDELLEMQRGLAQSRRALDASASMIAGEIAHRSRRELGYGGLAQRLGFRSAEKLVQNETGSTARDATVLVTVGTFVRDADVDAGVDATAVNPSDRWLIKVGNAVASGSLSLQAAQSIRSGLGAPSEGVPSDRLAEVVPVLLAEAGSLGPDALFVRARQLRDDLDLAGVARRENQIHAERAIRRVRRPNGLSRYIVDPDLEAAAFWDDLYDRVTAPRRGNVRFLSEEDRAWADAASGHGVADGRTIDQYVHDTVTDLLRLAVATDTPASHRLIGLRQPSVRVLVTAEALESGVGVGHIEGTVTPISHATVERIACAAGTIAVTFDSAANGLDLGREQRLFSARQRIMLAARDGGCRMPGCDRPPGWCEAHHIDHWKRDEGPTNLDRGVLLCRHHHMLMHNNHWEIEHDGASYWVIPPADVDAHRVPRPMPTKSAALKDLQLVRSG